MFKQIVVGTIAVVAIGMPAYASPTLKALFDTIKATGTTIVSDSPRCKNPKLMGQYEYVRNQIDQLTICLDNHKGDEAELFDTILHESVHIAQACKGGALFSYESIIKAAKPVEIQQAGATYANDQFNTELEARVIARETDEVYVTNLIKEHCK